MGETAPRQQQRVTVVVEDHTGNKKRRARIAADVPVHELVPALITALELPVTDAAGRPVAYHIAVNGQQIQNAQTLEAADVVEGAALTIVPEMTAGGAALAESDAGCLVDWGPLERSGVGAPPGPAAVGRAWCGRELACAIEAGALDALALHVSAQTECEVGGLLAGRAWTHGRRTHVLVSSVLVAAAARGGPGSLHFGVDAWLELTSLRHASGCQVVGWYHSHPGLGVFLSSVDCDLHHAHFSGFPWYVALVADPLRSELGAFGYDAGALVRLAEAGRPGGEPTW